MGCSNSKLHNLPAVSLCRDRCKFLAEALHHIHSLSAAHVAYLQSLDSLGSSLHRFLDQTPIRHHSAGAGDDLKSKPPPAATATSVERTSSAPDLHIHFDDSESDDDNASKASSNSNNNKNLYHFEEPRHVIMESSYNFYETSAVFFDSPPPSAAPPPPPAAGLGWDILNLFDAYDRHLHVESMVGEVPVSTEEKRREKKEKKSAGEESVAEKKSAGEESTPEKKTEVNGEKERLVVKEAETTGSDKNKAVIDDIGREMQSLFEEAALSGRRVLMLLDAAKVRYLHNHGVTKEPISVAVSVGEEDSGSCGGCGGGDLSSILTKLSMWEKKLYHEVKAEGKLRILYAQKWRELKQLSGSSKNDAEAKKVESVRNLIVTVSAKLKIAFHVIDKVSMTLNSLRDQELWPWINQLIHGFQEMWQTMLTCHSSQHKLVEEFLKTLDGDSIKSDWTFCNGNRHLEESLKLRSDLHRWTISFCNWLNTQKRFTKSLNAWLLRCLEPQGEASSMDAPSVFVICSQWSKSLEMVSDKEVIEAGNGFLRAMEQHCTELMAQRAIAERREGKMKMEKKGVLLSTCGRNGAVGSDFCDGSNVSVQCCLKCTFEAVDKFGAVSLSVYQELCGNIA